MLCLHKPTAAHLCQLNKAQGFIKGNGFGRVVGGQHNLSDIPEAIQHSPHQRCTDATALIIRQHQNILDIYDGLTISDRADHPQKRVAFIGCQCQKRMLKTLLSAT